MTGKKCLYDKSEDEKFYSNTSMVSFRILKDKVNYSLYNEPITVPFIRIV